MLTIIKPQINVAFLFSRIFLKVKVNINSKKTNINKKS